MRRLAIGRTVAGATAHDGELLTPSVGFGAANQACPGVALPACCDPPFGTATCWSAEVAGEDLASDPWTWLPCGGFARVPRLRVSKERGWVR